MSFVKTILCPVDFSAGSLRAVEQAAQLALSTGANVELLHVYQLPTLALPDGVITATPDYVAKLTDYAQAELEKLKAALTARNVKASAHLFEGEPVATILARAKEIAASMLVVGTHGRSGFKRFILGSVTERLVRLSNIPVLTVHLGE